ncbi:MAG TPA: carbohydrate kinase family protein [Candidatus Paceibacterota bacterium]
MLFGKKIDLLTIGDTAVDAFIRIKEASVNCDVDRHNCKLCMNFADKIPYESVEIVPAVGNSANAAVAAAKLGISTGLVSDLGNDDYGRVCASVLDHQGVSTKHVSVHKNSVTNYHYVLWYEDERTILVKHEEYTRKFPTAVAPQWVYLSSLGSNSLDYHTEIIEWLKKHPEIKLVFQPGTFQMKTGVEKLKYLYERSEIFCVNVEEAQKILNVPNGEPLALLTGIKALGPKIVLVTDGPKGAYMYDGVNAWFMPIYPDPKPPLERTGCGDAFASTFMSALMLGKSPEEALLWAPINPMWVVQHVGAQKGLLTRAELEDFLAKAPTDYKPRKIN